MYQLQWRSPSLDVNKSTPIQVAVGSIVTNKASLRFTGKGAANYGAIQQENVMRLLEHFAGPTGPDYPTIGQLWYDSVNNILQLCTSTVPLVWKSLSGIQITNPGAPAPAPAVNGDFWYQKTGTSSGIFYVYTGVGRFPFTSTSIGGWSQIWPQVETVAGREEYDAVFELLNSLIGPTSGGGNAALGKIINNLTPLSTLDTSLRNNYALRTPLDANVLTPTNTSNSEMLVDVTSQDWDTLLAAARYAVKRLELPDGFYDDISPVPFVSDGRPAPSSLLALDPTDVRYPSLERRSNRRFGIVTLVKSFAETVNVLRAAINNRYSLKGINGSSGSNTTFDSNVQMVHHVQFGGALGGSTSANLTMRFNFPDTAARTTFLNSGGAIQMTLGMSGMSTTGDTNMRALTDQRGVLRITADKTRVFANALPLLLAIAPENTGFNAATGGPAQMTAQSVNGATYIITASYPSATTLALSVSISSGSNPMQGTFTVKFDVIKDTTTYLAPGLTKVFGEPAAYATGDKTAGSASLVFQL